MGQRISLRVGDSSLEILEVSDVDDPADVIETGGELT